MNETFRITNQGGIYVKAELGYPTDMSSLTYTTPLKSFSPPLGSPNKKYKYNEQRIIDDFKNYVDKTYGEHYTKDDIQCFDTWVAKGTASSTSIDTAQKYLWRYGQKEGKNKKDLLKAMHYILLCMHVDHYKE